ncbi:hypothetical protein AB8880_12810 [Alphaproteobacteria bacterium LSUCC0684]
MLTTLKKVGTYSILSVVFLIITWLTGKNEHRIFAALSGFAISFAVVTVFGLQIPNNNFHSNPWLVGLGEGITLLPLVLIAFLPRFSMFFTGGAWFVLFAHFHLGSRNLLLVTFITLLLVYFSRRVGSSDPAEFTWRKLGRITRVTGVGVIVIIFTFFALLSKDLIPERMSQKVIGQMNTEYGLIAAARPDVLASIVGISKYPMTGYGSGMVDDEVFENYARFASGGSKSAYNETYSKKHEMVSSPSHSHLFGAWLDAGFLAAISWIFVLIFCIRMLATASFYRDPFTPLAIFLSLSTMWDVVFSPGPNRVELSLGLATLFLIARRYQQSGDGSGPQGRHDHPGRGILS